MDNHNGQRSVEEYYEPLSLLINGGKDVKGYVFVQIKRTDQYAIYAQRMGTEEGRILSYDVIKIRKQKAVVVNFGGVEQQLKAKEHYPSSRQWGTEAWSFPTLSLAESQYKSLTQSQIQKKR
jgi:hypothetical protein